MVLHNLIDLANPNRTQQTGTTEDRIVEGRRINMHLTILGVIIMQLTESQGGQRHVNLRHSKLTRLF